MRVEKSGKLLHNRKVGFISLFALPRCISMC